MDKWFFYDARIKRCVEDMRRGGLNDVQIGWIIYEIRAKSIQEERLRMDEIYRNNPPRFNVTGFDIADMLEDCKYDLMLEDCKYDLL
jgi:hypothetical protein